MAPHGPGRLRRAPLERLGRQAVRDVELGIELGSHEGGPQPRHHQRVDRAGVRVALGHHLWPACPSASSATWLPCEAPLTRNQVRRAPQASAASRWARSNGVGSRPTSMPHVSAGMSSASGARRAPRPGRVGAGAALVAGHVEAAGLARGKGAQGVEVGRAGLGHGRRVYGSRFSAGGRRERPGGLVVAARLHAHGRPRSPRRGLHASEIARRGEHGAGHHHAGPRRASQMPISLSTSPTRPAGG